jgi:hypothetical protein
MIGSSGWGIVVSVGVHQKDTEEDETDDNHEESTEVGFISKVLIISIVYFI